MRAAIYARVSSAQQAEAGTIASQVRALRDYVSRQDWTLAGEYLDDGKSADTGKLDARAGWSRMMRAAAAGALDVVVALDQSRITRTGSHAERGAILDALAERGVSLCLVNGGGLLDLRTGHGDLLYGIGSAMAREDNRKRTEASERGRREAALRGGKPCGRTPFGFRWQPRSRRERDATAWQVDEAQAGIVREVYRRILAGETCATIARDLDGRTPTPRGAQAWAGMVLRIARSPIYRGEYSWGGHAIAIPALVDAADWGAVQARLDQHRMRGLVRTRYEYLLGGLATCGLCGSAITPKGEARAKYRHLRYYGCLARLRPVGGAPCALPWSRCDAIDAAAWEGVRAALSQPRAVVLEQLAGILTAESDDAAAWARDAAEYERRLAQFDDVESGMLARHVRGLISEPALDRTLRDVASQREALRRQLATARDGAARLQSTVDAAALLDALRGLLESATHADRRVVVAALLGPRGAVLGPSGLVLQMRLGGVDAPGSRLSIVLASTARCQDDTLTAKSLK